MFPRAQMDAFYGSIEPYAYDRTQETVTYVFRRQRARGLARLIAWADETQGAGGYFVLETGLSGCWKDCRYLTFDIDDAFPDFRTIPADYLTIQIYDDRTAALTVRYKRASWSLSGWGVPDTRSLKIFMPLTINPTKMERYKVM